jgi:hypothetical protein
MGWSLTWSLPDSRPAMKGEIGGFGWQALPLNGLRVLESFLSRNEDVHLSL